MNNQDTIKTALLAYGMSGKYFHAAILQAHPGFQLMGAWERNQRKIAADYPQARSYQSLEELLQDEQVQLVVVNTPVDTHYTYTRQALEAGKHVLVEKAFTSNATEAMALVALANAKGLKLTVYQNRRYDSDFKTVQQVLNQNILGDIVEASISFDRYRPMLSTKAWKEQPNAGAGILKDLGSHIIDQAICLFGKPQAVFADIRCLRPKSQVDDQIDLLLYYANKRVRLHAGFYNREALPGYVLQGTLGSFMKARADVQEDQLKAGMKPGDAGWGQEDDAFRGLLHTAAGGKIIRQHIPTLPGDYRDFYEALYQSFIMDAPLAVSTTDAIAVMKIMDAALQSQANGCRQEIAH